MTIWKFDENRADFVVASLAGMEAAPDTLYVVQRGDVLMVCKDPMPEQLEVTGVMFDQEQFLGNHSACPSLPPKDVFVAERERPRPQYTAAKLIAEMPEGTPMDTMPTVGKELDQCGKDAPSTGKETL